MDCLNQLGSLKGLFVCLPAETALKNAALLDLFLIVFVIIYVCFFSDQIVPALNALSSVAENSSSSLAVPNNFHTVAIAVYLLPDSCLI